MFEPSKLKNDSSPKKRLQSYWLDVLCVVFEPAKLKNDSSPKKITKLLLDVLCVVFVSACVSVTSARRVD